MNESYIKNVIEAALLAAGRSLTVAEIIELFDEASRPSASAIKAALTSLEEDYGGRGIEVKETANGYRIQVRRALANEISRLWPERPPRYSRALLETLALIAYRQPITRAEIEAVRGVAVNPNIVKTLLERNWVRVVGQRDVPGRPELLGTTKDFLDYFGLRNLDELPPLAELKAMGDVNLQLDLAKDPAVAGDASDGGEAATASAMNASAADGDGGVTLESASAESGDDMDATSADDEGSDEDELSAADPQGSSEMVASPRHFDD
jgi:segregation and condensation protein B